MKVIKYIDAVDFIYDCISSEDCDLCWDDVSNLLRTITDRKKEKMFDFIVSIEFPNGVDDDEFIEFVKNEQSYIFKELGIDTDKNNWYNIDIKN